ncbi:MAG: YafY family transcriptional regulator [Actinomycetia bacterium]|nr:YafY family transcriptional regulator [Actinomycetes bacterium]
MSILLLLQTRERMTAQELADTLEVSVRTVYRDMESLSAAGVPLYGEPGHDGGYRLLGGFRTRLTGLTTDEANSLFLTGLPTAAADLGMGAVVTAVQLKLMASLPAELRDRAGQIAERFHLDAPAWYRDGDRPPHLSAVADAVWNNRAVRMRYLRWAEPHEITRTVEPYGLVLKAGHWYLVAGGIEQLRTYRISRIVDLHVLDERFDRPNGFDLADHWNNYLKSFDGRRHQDEATLRLSPRALGHGHAVADDTDRPRAGHGQRHRVSVDTAPPAAVADPRSTCRDLVIGRSRLSSGEIPTTLSNLNGEIPESPLQA